MSARVLVVDDDAALLKALPATINLFIPDVVIETSDSAADALELLDANDYDALISDIKMPGLDGLGLLGEVSKRRPRTPTLLITGHGDRELAVQALRGGAYDFIQKPLDRDYFIASLTRAIAMRHLDRETERQRLALERHARVLEHIGDGVFLLDGSRTIRLWNEAAATITGLEAAQVVGQSVSRVFPGWEELEPRIPISRVPGSTTDEARSVPIELNGHETWISIAGVESDDGIAYAFRSLRAERALEELRDEFIATASHELRTPVAAIFGAAETLRRRGDGLDDDQRAPLLDLIVGESQRLAQVLEDILVAGQLDEGRVPLESGPVDPLDLGERLLARIRSRVPARDIALVASSPLPPVRADPGKLQQVLENLLENALKYSSDDTRVELQLEANDGHIRFAVRDEGFGIPGDELRRIFTKFYRLDPQLTRGVGGTGLGLYISRELVHRMGGRISVSSQLGQGSTFTVELPTDTGERLAARERPSTRAVESVT